jgi:hypothetical protein
MRNSRKTALIVAQARGRRLRPESDW